MSNSYLFVRKEGFYTAVCKDDAEAIECALLNKGTLAVYSNVDTLIWSLEKKSEKV